MNWFERFIDSLSRLVQGWGDATVAIIMGVLAALAFYLFSVFLKKNKGANTRINGLAIFLLFIICLCLIFLMVFCLNY